MAVATDTLQESLSETFREMEQGLNGQAASRLHDVRKQALARFQELGFPTTRNENWKYTSLKPLQQHEFELAEDVPDADITREELKPLLLPEGTSYELVFVNGRFSKKLSRFAETSIEVKTFTQAAKGQDGSLLENLEQTAVADEALHVLNTAFAVDGTVIRVKRNTESEKPLHLLYINSKSDRKLMGHPRTIIHVEENSRLQVIESYRSISDQIAFTNSFTQFHLAQSAQAEYYKLQAQNENAFAVGTVEVTQQRDSSFASNTITTGGRLIRNNIGIQLKGTNCSSLFYGLYLPTGSQHIDNQSVVEHDAESCVSDQLYKGILGGKSRGVFSGKIVVQPDAQKTNAFQSNKNVLLTNSATIDSKPQLEIYADDVKCSHGATMGQLDKDALFYLRARGLRQEEAEALLNVAFVDDVLQQVKIEPLKAMVTELVYDKLKNMG